MIDNPGVLSLLIAFGTYRVRIGVAPEDVEMARTVLSEWDAESGPAVRDLSRQLTKQVALAGGLSFLFALGAAIFARGWDLVPWLACATPAVFVLSFLAISFYQRSRVE